MMSLYEQLYIELIDKLFNGAPDWIIEYVVPTIIVISITVIFGFVIHLIFRFVYLLTGGGYGK